MQHISRWIFCGLIVLTITLFSTSSFGAETTISVEKTQIRATISATAIEVRLPMTSQDVTPAECDLTVSIEDLQGMSLGSNTVRTQVSREPRDVQVVVNVKVDSSRLPAYVVHYTVKKGDEVIDGQKSLFYAVRQVETRLLMQSEFYAGSQAAVRVVVLDASAKQPQAGANVKLLLEPQEVFVGTTDAAGTVDATFTVPEGMVGDQRLTVLVKTDDAEDVIRQPIQIKNAYKMLLTTDKPLYQPGQMIHIRNLALRMPDLKPALAHEILLEVEDAKGNKVFKQNGTTDQFGISAADFQLASELNEGAYKIKATLGANTTEKTVTVQRYVLPKFNLVFQTDKPFYQPGHILKGDLQVDYFFGKPVANGTVVVTLSKFDVQFEAFAEVKGKTDANGHYQFETKLPDYFVGQPLEQGKAFVKMDIVVTDTAEHEEKKTVTKTVAAAPLNVVVIPESGAITPGLENIFYVAASYPDGTPAEASVDVKIDAATPITLTTDASGIGEFRFTPLADTLTMTLQAKDNTGNSLTRTLEFTAEARAEHILVRANKALYTVGDTIEIAVFSTKSSGAVYVDLIKAGQTFLTRTLDLKDGRGSLALDATVAGSLQLHVYQILPSSDIMRDTKILYVEAADELKIAMNPDKSSYLPGEDAHVTFQVTNRQGHPVLAALGVTIVDESVFALQEMQPGLEKIYFMLEKDLMTPRYEIHGYSMEQILTPLAAETAPRREKAAQALFAATEQFVDYAVNLDTFAQKSQQVHDLIWEPVTQDFQKIYQAIAQFSHDRKKVLKPQEGIALLVEKGLVTPEDLRDPWGNDYRIRLEGDDVSYITFLCFGPDENEGTPDDVWFDAYYEVTREPTFFDWLFGRRKAGAPGVFRKGDVIMDMAVPMAAQGVDKEGFAEETQKKNGDDATSGESPRIREYFPETLYTNPAVLTDELGKAVIYLKMADSITTWRLTGLASSLTGTLGSTTAAMKVFQDFFVDIDLPVTLTQNDQVSIPIAIYNYLPGTQDVQLKLTQEPWFELVNDIPEKVVTLSSGQVDVVYFTLKVKQLGWHKLTVHAYGSQMSDAIARNIEVLPDGKMVELTWNGRLNGDVEQIVSIPKEALEDASKILVKVYPGILSQIVEGLDAILQMPSGCFEQTSSTTYPNILVLDYMKQAKQITPEIQMKAESYINTGYQRLLSYEVSGGGFEWFGQSPAHKILTAYGLMEFYDMAQVHDVDPNVIARTQQWLISQQEADGSWKPTQQYLDVVASKFTDDVMRNTAYITWALLATGSTGEAVHKAVQYIQDGLDEIKDPYTLALVANALVLYQRDDPVTIKLLETLLNKKQEQDGKVWWAAESATATNAAGKSGDIETTALIALALLSAEQSHETVGKILTYLIENKDPQGTWFSTQATILAMKALLLSMKNATQGTNAEVTVFVNGAATEGFALTPENSDVMRLLDLKAQTIKGDNQVKIQFDGEGSALYQIVGRFYLPWQGQATEQQEPLSITVAYDKTQLVKDDTLTATVVVKNNRPAQANMVIVDLGVPPGFEVESGDLAELVGDGVLSRFQSAGRQIIVYLDHVDQKQPVEFSYRLQAKFPVKAKTPKSTVYEYYNPDIRDEVQPQELTVKAAAAKS